MKFINSWKKFCKSIKRYFLSKKKIKFYRPRHLLSKFYCLREELFMNFNHLTNSWLNLRKRLIQKMLFYYSISRVSKVWLRLSKWEIFKSFWVCKNLLFLVSSCSVKKLQVPILLSRFILFFLLFFLGIYRMLKTS